MEVNARSTSPTRQLRLAVLTTHPIQYFAPWFRHLAKIFDLEVLYAHQQDARGQSDAGFNVAFEWDVPLLEGYRHCFLKNVSRSPGLKNFYGCDTPELYDLIRPQRYDALLVLGWNKKSYIQGIRAAWRNNVPVLSRGDSQLPTQRSWVKRALKLPLYRWFLPRIDAHLYVGHRNREYLKHYGVQDRQLFFAPHFVDNDFFAARVNADTAAAIRDRFNIPQDATVALFAGKFLEKKRPLDFVRAGLRAMKRRHDLHLLLVGDGPLRSELEREAAQNRHVHFAGFRNQKDMPAAYAASDILVLPSDARETWGLVVNEAMASAIPAIVSDAVGCAPDMIDLDFTGCTYPLGDVGTLEKLLIAIHPMKADRIHDKTKKYSLASATDGLKRALHFVHSLNS